MATASFTRTCESEPGVPTPENGRKHWEDNPVQSQRVFAEYLGNHPAQGECMRGSCAYRVRRGAFTPLHRAGENPWKALMFLPGPREVQVGDNRYTSVEEKCVLKTFMVK